MWNGLAVSRLGRQKQGASAPFALGRACAPASTRRQSNSVRRTSVENKTRTWDGKAMKSTLVDERDSIKKQKGQGLGSGRSHSPLRPRSRARPQARKGGD